MNEEFSGRRPLQPPCCEPSVPMLIHRIDRVFGAKMDDECRRLGVGGGMRHILYFLSRSGEVTQNELAGQCRVRPSTVSVTLLKMENAGLIVRRRDESDARRVYVALTPAGIKADKDVFTALKRTDRETVAPLDESEQLELKRLLLKVCDGLGEAHQS